MTRINDEFMEAYKRIDNLCRDMFQEDRGVTAYINAMQDISDGSRYVSDWNSTLRKLKELRHIRNYYSHEVGSSYEDICSIDEIAWLNSFYNAILHSDDPLSLYRKAHTSSFKHRDTTAEYDDQDNNSSSKVIIRILIGLLVNAAIVVIICLAYHYFA